jgi:hypothetical protein
MAERLLIADEFFSVELWLPATTARALVTPHRAVTILFFERYEEELPDLFASSSVVRMAEYMSFK